MEVRRKRIVERREGDNSYPQLTLQKVTAPEKQRAHLHVYNWLARFIAALLVVDLMKVGHSEKATVIWLYLGI